MTLADILYGIKHVLEKKWFRDANLEKSTTFCSNDFSTLEFSLSIPKMSLATKNPSLHLFYCHRLLISIIQT
jgi:hypothetical protein